MRTPSPVAIRPLRRSPVPERRLALGAVVLTALLTVAACGSDGSDGSVSPAPSASVPAEGTSLTIVATAAEDAVPKTYTLTCDPAGGDHPQAQEACDAVAKAGADVFDPVPGDQACTEIYGGPQVATVKGTFDGRAIDASFSRTNGCEIDRWERLGTTFFNVPLQ